MIVLHPTSLQQLVTAFKTPGFQFPYMRLYSGTMPVVDGTTTWSSTSSAAQAVCANFGTPININTVNNTLTFNVTPANPVATATATITWFALYDGQSTSTESKVIFGTVGTQAGGGTAPLLLGSTSAVNGQPISLIQLSIGFA